MLKFIIKARKIVTVSEQGTILNGAMVIYDRKIIDIGEWEIIQAKYSNLPLIDNEELVITPSLVDCHTHLIEFAPSSLFPITSETQLLAAKSLFLSALSSGITALGEQICGSPMLFSKISEVKAALCNLPLDISFASTSISLGLEKLVHFTSVTGRAPVTRDVLVHPGIVASIAQNSEYAGENIFINATPANFTKDLVPRAGEIIYTDDELKSIVSIFHSMNKKIGTHVAGEQGIDMALNAKFDVLHHAHGITDEQLARVSQQNGMIVATPLGGTHLPPNTLEEVEKMIKLNIPVAISTDGYLPLHERTVAFPKLMDGLVGPEYLMNIASPFMKQLVDSGYDENKALEFITLNSAKVMGKEHLFGSLTIGKDANFLVADGVPGLEIVDQEQIKSVYFRGRKVIQR